MLAHDMQKLSKVIRLKLNDVEEHYWSNTYTLMYLHPVPEDGVLEYVMWVILPEAREHLGRDDVDLQLSIGYVP